MRRDGETWIGDPEERWQAAFREMYTWYRDKQAMMENVLRDAHLVPALGAVMDQRWWPLVNSMVAVLATGTAGDGPKDPRIRAVLRLFLDFHTWRTLAGTGLADDEAARLATQLVAAAE